MKAGLRRLDRGSHSDFCARFLACSDLKLLNRIIMAMPMPRWLSLPSVSAFINFCCIIVLCFNLIQNHVSFHESAIRQSATLTQQTDGIPPPPVDYSSANSNLRGGTSSEDAISAISMTIPRGKSVALPSITISEEEEKNIKRDIYGGKGDKPHLGGFTEFDVRKELSIVWRHGICFILRL
jgi:hypothetical protein